jgi:hypothetical protein
MKTQSLQLLVFKGKANILIDEKESRLISYNTEVATYDHTNKKATIKGWYSATTSRHINAFLKFYGLDPMNKKQMQKK